MESTIADHSGRKYLVLGATGGIGSCLARRLAVSGAQVFLAGRDETKLSALADELGAPSRECDATSFASVEDCVNAACQTSGTLAGVVNCVGSLLLKPAHLTSPAEYGEVIATNLTSAFATVRAATRAMREAGGSVVLISSGAARTGLPMHEAIAAAKAGVIGLVQSAAATYGPHGIRINAVAPGLTRTPMTARITENERSAKVSLSMHALGRLGEPEDIASAIAWLLSAESDWVTGQVLGVDGGLATTRNSRS